MTLANLEKLLKLAREHDVEELIFNGVSLRLRARGRVDVRREGEPPPPRPPLDELIKNDPAFEAFEHGMMPGG